MVDTQPRLVIFTMQSFLQRLCRHGMEAWIASLLAITIKQMVMASSIQHVCRDCLYSTAYVARI